MCTDKDSPPCEHDELIALVSRQQDQVACLTATIKELRKELAEAKRAGSARQLRKEGLEVGAELFRGKPSSVIADLARRTDHSMIVLAAHGRSRVSRMLLGSVAEAVVRESGDPVLIVRS